MKFIKNETGATAVEYAIIIALISAVIIGSVSFLGTRTLDIFDKINAAFSGEILSDASNDDTSLDDDTSPDDEQDANKGHGNDADGHDDRT